MCILFYGSADSTYIFNDTLLWSHTFKEFQFANRFSLRSMSLAEVVTVFLRLIMHVIKDGELEDYTHFPGLTEPKCWYAEPLKQDSTGTASLELCACMCLCVIRGLSDPTLIRLDIISTKDKRVCMDLFSALWLCACRNTKRTCTSTHTHT